MSVSDSLEMQAIVEDSLHTMRRHLLQQTPFLDAAALNSALVAAGRTTKKTLQQQRIATEKSRARFDFFKLPAELRNRIYELVILGRHERKVYDENDPENWNNVCIQNAAILDNNHNFFHFGNCINGEPDYNETRQKDAMPPSLAQVCRRIRNETLPIFYGQKTFTAYVNTRYMPTFKPGTMAGVTRWLRCVGTDQVPLIKHLRIRLPLVSHCVIRCQCVRRCHFWKPKDAADVVAQLGLEHSGVPPVAIIVEAMPGQPGSRGLVR